jgi:TolA-binding protein
MKRLTVFCLITLVSFAFAGRRAQMRNDITAAKATADSALLMALEAREELSRIQARQLEIMREQKRLAVMLDDVSPTRIEGAEIKLAYLTEAFRDLYSQVGEIQLIPVIARAQNTVRPSGFSVSAASRILSSDEYSLFSRGLDSFRKKFFDESRQIMREIINSFPEGHYIDRAYFWIAESHFAEKNYSLALQFYQKVLNFPGSSKADDAQFKIAVCYSLLGEPEKAFEEYKVLVQRHPASVFVGRANEAIRRILEERNSNTGHRRE